MTINGVESKGHGKDYDCWEQLYQVKYFIAVANDTHIEQYWNLTKIDIKRLAENKSIVILKRKLEPINDENELEKNELFEDIPLTELDWNYPESPFDEVRGYICEDDDTFPIIISMLRKKITKKRILKDMKAYIEELQNEIATVLYQPGYDYTMSEISELCNKWYNNSEEKEKMNILQRKINSKK